MDSVIDLSKLFTLVKSLNDSLESVGTKLVIATAAVVLGLLIEYEEDVREVLWAVVKDIRDIRNRHWFRNIRAVDRKVRRAVLGGIFVTGGVGAELLYEHKASTIEGSLQSANGQIVAFLNGKASAAELATQELKAEAEKAHKQAEDAAKARAAVEKQTAQLKLDAQKLEADNLKTKGELINLAVCNSPRIIPPWHLGERGEYTDPLKAITGRPVIVEFIPDAEARRAARYIADTLDRAKWDVKLFRPVDGLRDGVDVQPSEGRIMDLDGGSKTIEIAGAIVDFLHSYNWQATLGVVRSDNGGISRDGKIVPVGTIRIQVGLYPAVEYVGTPGSKEFEDWMAQFNKHRDDSKKETDERMRKQRERMLNELSPAERKRAEDFEKQMDADRNRMMSRYNNPCQPITPILSIPFPAAR